MRSNLKRTAVAVAVVVLSGTGSVFASPQESPPAVSHQSEAYSSERASTLLAEIQREAAGLTRNAEKLRAFAKDTKFSWQSHANYLQGVKDHINTTGKHIAELEQIRDAALPWQQRAITEVTTHAAQVAASTQAAIEHLNENQHRLFVAEYRDHLKTLTDSSAELKQTVDKYRDYEKTYQKFERLQNELELEGA